MPRVNTTLHRTLLAPVLLALLSGVALAEPATTPLREGWSLQTSVKATGGGAAISQPGFSTAGWYTAQVPSTVLGSLVKAGVYKDPFFGKNMTTIPEAPFKTSWWYRVQWNDKAPKPGDHVRVVFEGINYKADVWFERQEGRRPQQDPRRLAGAGHRGHRRAARRRQRAGGRGVPPKAGDYTIGFVDWNPCRPTRTWAFTAGSTCAARGRSPSRSPSCRARSTPSP
jgi:exo-1,4-beta-D-glucosaminidase